MPAQTGKYEWCYASGEESEEIKAFRKCGAYENEQKERGRKKMAMASNLLEKKKERLCDLQRQKYEEQGY